MIFRKINIIFALVFTVTAMYSCDDGDINEEYDGKVTEGRTIILKGKFRGAESWSDYYNIVVAGFADSEYSVIQKTLPSQTQDGETEVMLSNIPVNVTTIELCVTNKLRERILTFHSTELGSYDRDTLMIDAGEINIGMFSSIQEYVFNTTCAQCHGGSTDSPAAGLNLTNGKSYKSLVGVPSTRIEGGTRVVPGMAQQSILHQTINAGYSLPLNFDHANMISSTNMLSLIERWIDDGAKE